MRIVTDLIAPIVFVAALFLFFVFLVTAVLNDWRKIEAAEYKESVLPAAVIKRVAVEALAKDSWYKYVGLNGAIIGMDTFGESAPAKELYELFGITTQAVVDAANAL